MALTTIFSFILKNKKIFIPIIIIAIVVGTVFYYKYQLNSKEVKISKLTSENQIITKLYKEQQKEFKELDKKYTYILNENNKYNSKKLELEKDLLNKNKKIDDLYIELSKNEENKCLNYVIPNSLL